MPTERFIKNEPAKILLSDESGSGSRVLNTFSLLQESATTFGDILVGTDGTMTAPGKEDARPGLVYILDGATVEPADIGWTESAGTVSLTIEADGGGDVQFYFGGVPYTLDCTPADSVALSAGSDTEPQINYVFVTESSGVLTLTSNTSGWPDGTPHAPIASVVVQSAASCATDGPYKLHVWTDHLESDGVNGHLSHINKKLRVLPATWVSGVAASSLSGTGQLSTTAGVVFQLHEHDMEARDMASLDPVFVANDSGSAFKRITDFGKGGISTLADGTSIGNNKYVNLVLWGVVNEDASDCKLMINLPTGEYTNSSRAQLDVDQTAVYSLGADFVGTAFLIARYTAQYSTGGGGGFTQVLNTDLRGLLPSTSAGGGALTDHGDLSGLSDNDHPQYALAAAGAFTTAAPTSAVAASGSTDLIRKGEADAAFQPIDADLTAVAALTTAATGRSLLTGADKQAIAAITKAPYVIAQETEGSAVGASSTAFHELFSFTIPANALGTSGRASIKFEMAHFAASGNSKHQWKLNGTVCHGPWTGGNPAADSNKRFILGDAYVANNGATDDQRGAEVIWITNESTKGSGDAGGHWYGDGRGSGHFFETSEDSTASMTISLEVGFATSHASNYFQLSSARCVIEPSL